VGALADTPSTERDGCSVCRRVGVVIRVGVRPWFFFPVRGLINRKVAGPKADRPPLTRPDSPSDKAPFATDVSGRAGRPFCCVVLGTTGRPPGGHKPAKNTPGPVALRANYRTVPSDGNRVVQGCRH